MSEVQIRPAGIDDTDRLVTLYHDAQRWLADNGSDQWARNTSEKTRAKFTRSIEHGECFVAESGGELIGMITVDDYADPEFWRPEDDPTTALYVHRMVVDRAMAGRNVGGLLLDWAAKITASRGRRWLRLDAWRTNTALHKYYERQGFTPVRTVELNHRGSGALFQRRVELR